MKSIEINRNTSTKKAKKYLHLAVTEKGLDERGQLTLLNKFFPGRLHKLLLQKENLGPLFCQKLSAMPPKGYVDIKNGAKKLRQFLLQMRLRVQKLVNIIVI